MKEKSHKVEYIVLGCMAVLAGIIWTCTNFGFDEGYQICLANRLLTGDKLLVHMWEPHQTSVFICALFMWIYKLVFHSYEGVVIYLHALGTVLRLLVALAIYGVLKKEVEKELAFFSSVLFFMITPKDFSIAEFSNLQVWFATFAFLFLLIYFRKKNRFFIVLAAVMVCLDVIVYPSCIIIALPTVILLGIYSEKGEKIKNTALFTGVCFLLGGITLAYLLIHFGFDYLMQFYQNMISIEPNHNVSLLDKLLSYGKDAGVIVLIIAGVLLLCALFAFLMLKLSKGKIAGDSGKLFIGFMLAASFVVFLGYFLVNILVAKKRCNYSILFLYMTGLGFYFRNYLSAEEKRIWDTGSIISIAGFAATLLLTDLPFLVSGAYLVLAVALSALPIIRFAGQLDFKPIKKIITVCGFVLVGLLLFRCIYIRTPLTGRGQICTILNTDLSFVHFGPAKGMITDDEGAKRQQISYEEFREYIPEGSNIWIIDSMVDGLGYLYGNYRVATPSCISDPKILPGITSYWEQHPEKYPDVIIIGAYDGQLSYEVLANEWFMGWLKDEYQPARFVDGVFWRYYFRR